jgi:hypothetical protein
MPSLRELQAQMARAVLAAPAPGLLAAIAPGGVSPQRRLAVYRNNVQYALYRVLEGNFPATRRVAGEQPFRAAAHDFLRHHPPAQPQLHAWGGDLVGFLREHPATGAMPWLADLAGLEWAREWSYYAADAPVLEPSALAALPEDRCPALRLLLHPTARLIASPWPVYGLWLGKGAVPPQPAAEHVLAVRPHMEVLTLPLGVGEHALLAALCDGAELADAAEAAAEREPALELMRVLARHLAGGTFTAFA